MKRRLWMVLPVLLAVAGGGSSLIALWLRPAPEKLRLIAGRAPVVTGVTPPRQLPWEIPLAEYQIYSWQADYYQVCGEAAEELTALGFECRPLAEPFTICFSNGGLDVWIVAKRSMTRRAAYTRGSDDLRWVTVIVWRDAAPGIRTSLKSVLEPSY